MVSHQTKVTATKEGKGRRGVVMYPPMGEEIVPIETGMIEETDPGIQHIKLSLGWEDPMAGIIGRVVVIRAYLRQVVGHPAVILIGSQTREVGIAHTTVTTVHKTTIVVRATAGAVVTAVQGAEMIT